MMDLNTIATLANKITKPNKAYAFHLVKSLAISGEPANLNELAILYAFFLPPVPVKPKTPEQWVYKAVPKNDIRKYLNSLHVKKGVLMGTDGHRVHFTKTDLADGFYNSQLTPITVDGKYPDIDRIIPKGLPCLGQFPTDLEVIDGEVLYYLVNKSKFNKKYIDQALSGMENPILHQCEDAMAAILVTSDNLNAAIMPMRY